MNSLKTREPQLVVSVSTWALVHTEQPLVQRGGGMCAGVHAFMHACFRVCAKV